MEKVNIINSRYTPNKVNEEITLCSENGNTNGVQISTSKDNESLVTQIFCPQNTALIVRDSIIIGIQEEKVYDKTR